MLSDSKLEGCIFNENGAAAVYDEIKTLIQSEELQSLGQ